MGGSIFLVGFFGWQGLCFFFLQVGEKRKKIESDLQYLFASVKNLTV